MRTPILVILAIAVGAAGVVWWSSSRPTAEEAAADATAEGYEAGAAGGKRRKGLAVEAQRNPRLATKNVKVTEVTPSAKDARNEEVPAEHE